MACSAYLFNILYFLNTINLLFYVCMMAEGDDSSKDRFNKKSPYSDELENGENVKLDIGINMLTKNNNNSERPPVENNFGASTSGISEHPKREDNPFSFKHFLRNDSTNYQNQGARPKVYCDGRPISSVSDLDLHQITETKQTRIVPEFSSALPDFVQDHLVIEQCYLGKDTHKSFIADTDNLPDFTPARSNLNINRVNSSRETNGRCSNLNKSIPLDLPIRPQADFPLDLPITEPQSSANRSCPGTEVGVSKSLPDFLADGAVQSRANDVTNNHSPIRDVDRLQRELDLSRRQLAEQIRLTENIQKELEDARSREHEYTQNLAKALEQVEENLERSNKRVASAETTISKLRQEIKVLTSENKKLKQESGKANDEEGAIGGVDACDPSKAQSRRLAQELRSAASSAEQSLRQLLTGVDNLRIMASSLENMHRIQEEQYINTDNDAGPTL